MAADASHGIAASGVFGGIPRIPALDFPDCATRRCDPGRMPASRGTEKIPEPWRRKTTESAERTGLPNERSRYGYEG